MSWLHQSHHHICQRTPVHVFLAGAGLASAICGGIPRPVCPILGASDLPKQTSIYDDGCAPPSMAPIVRPSVEEAQFRSTTRSARFRFPTPLSPILEDSERVESEPSSPVKTLTLSPGCIQKADITFLEPRRPLSPIPTGPL